MSGSGLSRVSAHRRPLVTAAVAGGLLLALWFVPSANATQEAPKGHPQVTDHQPAHPR
ncbi:hypothetical protein GCM10009801_28060 [Streptomyces albiaxialis]|uniref:Uncharacterized protein n=1 Tax=Streptomyces albiaxialis TaxID=329523 RepID=A0ABN2VVQ9_9ACTN